MRQVLPKREGAILSSQTVPLCPLVWWQLFSLARINDLARGACGVRFPKSSVQKGSERHWLLPKTNNQKETKKKTKKKGHSGSVSRLLNPCGSCSCFLNIPI